MLDAGMYVPNATPLSALQSALNPTSATPAASRFSAPGILGDPTLVLVLFIGAFLGVYRFGIKFGVETGVGQ